MEKGPLLAIENVSKWYSLKRHWWNKTERTTAVDRVSISIHPGESFGLVGESGSGKSTLARMIAMLEMPNEGYIFFDGKRLDSLAKEQRRLLRRELQIVWQDSSQSLNPRYTVREAIEEPLHNFDLFGHEVFQANYLEIMDMVSISPRLLERLPHELSGGERQRVCIARALIVKPRMIVFDEATTGLDATLQYRFLELMQHLKQQLGLTYLVITHNLEIIPFVTDRFAVMQRGCIVETRESSLMQSSKHSYTRTLLEAIPAHHPSERKQ